MKNWDPKWPACFHSVVAGHLRLKVQIQGPVMVVSSSHSGVNHTVAPPVRTGEEEALRFCKLLYNPKDRCENDFIAWYPVAFALRKWAGVGGLDGNPGTCIAIENTAPNTIYFDSIQIRSRPAASAGMHYPGRQSVYRQDILREKGNRSYVFS